MDVSASLKNRRRLALAGRPGLRSSATTFPHPLNINCAKMETTACRRSTILPLEQRVSRADPSNLMPTCTYNASRLHCIPQRTSMGKPRNCFNTRECRMRQHRPTTKTRNIKNEPLHRNTCRTTQPPAHRGKTCNLILWRRPVLMSASGAPNESSTANHKQRHNQQRFLEDAGLHGASTHTSAHPPANCKFSAGTTTFISTHEPL